MLLNTNVKISKKDKFLKMIKTFGLSKSETNSDQINHKKN